MNQKIKNIIKIFIPSFVLIFYSKIRYRILFSRFINKFDGLVLENDTIDISFDCEFGKHVKIYERSSLSKTKAGDFTYFASGVSVTTATFGKYCSVGPGARIGLGMHPTENIVSTHPAFFAKQNASATAYADKNYFVGNEEIIIGNDVWIGANAMIKDGVKIGDGAIVGAGAIVTKDVAPYCIVAGVPAKPIRNRFTNEEILFLLELKWWDKPENWIKENWKDFLDIKRFISNNS